MVKDIIPGAEGSEPVRPPLDPPRMDQATRLLLLAWPACGACAEEGTASRAVQCRPVCGVC